MSRRPLVSVITPFLNAERYLGEAIESVLAQTYADWELLLIDDGSTDGSTAIARRYAEQHPARVRYLEHSDHQNLGKSASRNLGVNEAQGDPIALLDADDVWLPHKLERQVTALSAHPDAALALSPSDFWYPDQGVRKPRRMTLEPGHHPPGAYVRRMLENDGNIATTCGVLVRRDAIIRAGGFESPWGLYEDQVLWCKIGLHAAFCFDPEPVALYRQHAASSWWMHTADEKLLAQLQFYAWLAEYLVHHRADRFGSVLLAVRLHALALRHFVDSERYAVATALASCLEQQLAEPPQDGEWHYLTAFSLHQAETRLSEALQRYDRALEYGFDEFWVRYNRGDLHRRLGHLGQAREDLRRAVELQPGHEGAWQLLGRLTGGEPSTEHA